MIRVACAVPFLALACGLAAAQQGGPVHRAALVAEHSALDRGQPDWDLLTLQVGRHWSQRQLVEVELTETRRFGRKDTEWAVSGAAPLGEKLTGSARVSHSPTHRVLARSSIAAGLQYEFRPAWLLHGTVKQTRYDATDVEQASVMLEHYFGDWSAAAVVHGSRAFGESTQAGELRLAWYYAQGSSLALFAAAGEEAAQVGPAAVAIAKVRSLALVGRHALSPRWTLRYGLHRVRQGDFHTRSGATLGVQAAF
jgi:YaiO family outer membrane protein